MTEENTARLDADRRKRMQQALIKVAEGMGDFSKEAQAARQEGEISEDALHSITMLNSAALLNVTNLVMGLYANFNTGNQREVTKPVADSELPDWDLVTTDVPDN